MAVKADEISRIIEQKISGFETGIDLQETGTVISVGDGIARIYGLENAMSGELVEFPHNIIGMVLNLEEDNIGTVIFGDFTEIGEGDIVKRTNRIAQVPVGGRPHREGRRRPGESPRWKGPNHCQGIQKRRAEGSRCHCETAREGASPDRYKGDRRHDPDRKGTA